MRARRRARVLLDVRQRLLHEPVDGRLDLGVERRQVELERDLEPRRLAASRSASASSAGASPSWSSAAGRRSLMIARRFSTSPVICSTAASTCARSASTSGSRAPADRPSAQRREPLERLVVQLARPAPALLLGGADRVAQAVVLDVLRGGHRGRRAGGEGEQEPLVLGVEAPVAVDAVERREDADRRCRGTRAARRAPSRASATP